MFIFLNIFLKGLYLFDENTIQTYISNIVNNCFFHIVLCEFIYIKKFNHDL